jgi:hypothetical protein
MRALFNSRVMNTHGGFPQAAYIPKAFASSTWNRFKCTPRSLIAHFSNTWKSSGREASDYICPNIQVD